MFVKFSIFLGWRRFGLTVEWVILSIVLMMEDYSKGEKIEDIDLPLTIGMGGRSLS